MREIQRLIDEYWAWLRAKTSIREVGEWVEITTPYLDRHNDHLQIFAKSVDGEFILSDDGYIVQDLVLSGCDIHTPKRVELLNVTLQGFGVSLVGDALEVRATPESFARKKHSLVQAMLAVNDMFYLSQANVVNVFWEDVKTWLNESGVRSISRVKLTGKSGFDHLYDHVIPASMDAPERYIQVVSRPSKQRAETTAFAWLDTKGVREPSSKAYAILNDQEKGPSSEVLDALNAYSVKPILWSRRDVFRGELVA